MSTICCLDCSLDWSWRLRKIKTETHTARQELQLTHTGRVLPCPQLNVLTYTTRKLEPPVQNVPETDKYFYFHSEICRCWRSGVGKMSVALEVDNCTGLASLQLYCLQSPRICIEWRPLEGREKTSWLICSNFVRTSHADINGSM